MCLDSGRGHGVGSSDLNTGEINEVRIEWILKRIQE